MFNIKTVHSIDQYFFPGNNKERSINNKTGDTVRFNIDDKNTMGVAIIKKETPGGAAY